MKRHKVVITIEGSPNKSKVTLSMKFDPPINMKAPAKNNCLEGVACRIISAVRGATTEIEKT